jgi:hypothetical protein
MYVEARQEVTAWREHYAATPLPAPTHLRECGKQEGKPANWPNARWTRGCVFSGTSATKGCRREALWSAAACRRFPSPEACFRQHLEQARDKKAAASCRTPKLTFCRCSPASALRGSKKDSSKLNDRRGNVYENKGTLWKTRRRSWNVYENKRT